MVGSIDPRCETVRGTHWPNQGRVVVWSSRRGNHLGQRSIATASTGRTYGCKRSDQTRKTLAARGPSTYGSRLAGSLSSGGASRRPVGLAGTTQFLRPPMRLARPPHHRAARQRKRHQHEGGGDL